MKADVREGRPFAPAAVTLVGLQNRRLLVLRSRPRCCYAVSQ